MTTGLRLTRVVLLLLLATATLALVTALASADTGYAEKAVLVALIAGCLYLAARVPALVGWIQTHSTRH